ncbi:hypothetical protein Ahia01_000821200, partial [Argonauta hians]
GQATVKSLLLVAWTLLHFKGNGVEADSEGCVVRGRTYPLGQPFSFTNGCFQYSCNCKRDGSFDCPIDRTRNICNQNRRGPTRKHKRQEGCKVKGRFYSLNRPFSFTDECFKYNCVCKSDGSWDCPASRTENICDKTEGQEVSDWFSNC